MSDRNDLIDPLLITDIAVNVPEKTKTAIFETWNTLSLMDEGKQRNTLNLIQNRAQDFGYQKIEAAYVAIKNIPPVLRMGVISTEIKKAFSKFINEYCSDFFVKPSFDYIVISEFEEAQSFQNLLCPQDLISFNLIMRLEYDEGQKYIQFSEEEALKWQSWKRYRQNFSEIPLPRFNEIVDYMAFLFYYGYLLDSYRTLELRNEIKQPINQLQTDLTPEQRGRLFDLLAIKGFIPTSPDVKENFVWAFGKFKEKQPSNWKPIEWPGKKNLLAYFVDIFNLKILNNERVVWIPFEKIFNQQGLSGSKNDYQKIGILPKKSEIIDTIIDEIMK